MSNLPVELVEMIAKSLNWHDVGNFRLCCRAFATIGTKYLMPNGEHVVWMHSSSLFAQPFIAEHPTISQYIESLHIELDGLEDEDISLQEYEEKVLELQHWTASANPEMPWARGDVRNKRFTRQGMADAYSRYKSELVLQRYALRSGMHHLAWTSVIASCSNLRSISLVSGHAFPPQVERVSPYRRFCVNDGHTIGSPPGVAELERLLKTVAKTGTKLESLRVGSISWELFDEEIPETPLETLFSPLIYLTTLKLLISTGFNELDEIGYDSALCAEALGEGTLRRAIKALPVLEVLHVDIDFRDEIEHVWGASSEDVLDAEGYWPRLKELALRTMEIKSASFMAFVTKHSSTLKTLELASIELDFSWLDLLPQIQTTLNLEKAIVCGELFGYVEDDGSGGWFCEEWFMRWRPEKDDLRDRLSAYLVNGGSCPLSHDEMQTLERY